jgi:hypothetical protein
VSLKNTIFIISGACFKANCLLVHQERWGGGEECKGRKEFFFIYAVTSLTLLNMTVTQMKEYLALSVLPLIGQY